MATLKQRLHKRNISGDYDTIHLHTTADLILMQDGTTKLSDKIASMDTAIAGKAAASHSHTNITGKAASATKLQTSRTIRANLGSTTAASFDGTANITPGVSGVLPVANGGTGVTSIAALKQALGIVDIPTTLGSTVSWAGYTWLVCHVTESYIYLITDISLETSRFGNTHTYANSELANRCTSFLNTINSADQAKLADITVNGVTSKVFVPSKEQCEGGFSWFNAAANRIALDSLGSDTAWWTSSPSSLGVYYAWFVDTAGSITTGSTNVSNVYRFRPCVAYKR